MNSVGKSDLHAVMMIHVLSEPGRLSDQLLKDGWPFSRDGAATASLKDFLKNLPLVKNPTTATAILESLFKSVDLAVMNDALFRKGNVIDPSAVSSWFSNDEADRVIWRKAVLHQLVRSGADFSTPRLYSDDWLAGQEMSVMAILVAQAHQAAVEKKTGDPGASMTGHVLELLDAGVRSDATTNGYIMLHMDLPRVRQWIDLFEQFGAATAEDLLASVSSKPIRLENIAFMQSRLALSAVQDALKPSSIHENTRKPS